MAYGTLHLRVLIQEIEAIAKLKSVSEAQVAAEAAADSVGEVGKSVVTAVTKPQEAVTGIGDGVKRLFGRTKRGSHLLLTLRSQKDYPHPHREMPDDRRVHLLR